MPWIAVALLALMVVLELLDPAAGPSFEAGAVGLFLFVVLLPAYVIWLAVKQGLPRW